MKTQILIIWLAALLASACASNGIAPMGNNIYMINRGGWPHMNGFAVEAECYRDANQFCINQGLLMVPVSATTIDGEAFAHNASCKLLFKAAASTNDPAYQAYQNGNLTRTEYLQPENQSDSQHQTNLQQFLAGQRQQQQDIQNNQKAFQQNLDRSVSGVKAFQFPPLTQQGQSSAFPNLQRDPHLPSALDMPGSSDMQTGKTKFGPDGRQWHEYHTITGYTYWQLDL